MMSGDGTNPISLIKKIKIGRPKHSLSPHPLRPITFHFCLKPPFPSPPPLPPPPPPTRKDFKGNLKELVSVDQCMAFIKQISPFLSNLLSIVQTFKSI